MSGLTSKATLIAPVAAAMLLSGCKPLPSSGPTAAQIVHRAQDTSSEFRFNIVPLDSKAVEELNQAQQNKAAATMTLALLASPTRPEVLGPGDVLNITIYEVGVSLFAGAVAPTAGVFDPSAHGEKLPAVTVDEQGRISLPYGGVQGGRTDHLGTASCDQPPACRAVAAPPGHGHAGPERSNTVIVSGNVQNQAATT
jgi:hypothetical protein